MSISIRHPRKSPTGATALKRRGRRAIAIWLSAEEYAAVAQVAGQKGVKVAVLTKNALMWSCRPETVAQDAPGSTISVRSGGKDGG